MRSVLKGKAGRITAALVALLAVVVLTSAALASAQADRPAAVTGLQASTGADGEIDVSWDAHPQTVKDYRVTWAKTGEDFRKWYVSGYSAFPTDTEHSITGLDDGEDYKVRVRARFDQGKPSHWSSTLTVAAGGAAPTPANEAPTGLPVITGTVRVGETLTADTSGISDGNGLTGVSYTYQWLRNDGSTDTNITGATGQSYTLTDDDLNKAIKVSVTFTDDDGYTATLTSAATGSVARPANQAPSGLPTITGTAQVGETLSADTSAISDGNGLTGVSYTYQWIRNDGSTDTEITGATGQTYTLTDDDLNKAIKVSVTFTDDDNYTATLTSAATGSVARPANEAPSGLPTITGTVQVGETLSADTSAISDGNGLTGVSYTYQWIRNDGNSDTVITGATGSTYVLTADDAGKAVKVQVGFTDDDGYTATLTSAATGSVARPEDQTPTGLPTITGTAAVGWTLSADTSGISDANGLTGVSYTYQWLRNDGSTDTNITGATGQSYTLTDDDLNKAIKVSVTFTDDDGYTATLTSAATGSVARPPNQTPSGLPTITGTKSVGETLSADTSGISDANGLTDVSYTYQWIRNDGNSDTNIPGATGSTYVLTADDAGKAIKVQVGFTDDDGYTATLTSAATGSVARPDDQTPSGLPTITGTKSVGETLSADTSGISDANGLTDVSYTYQWIRNDGNSDTNIPGATGSTYVLTADDAGKAIKVQVGFTDDDGYTATLTSAATGSVARPEDQTPSGLPAITGTKSVGETLSADTSAISDGNGLTGVSYTYQWIRNDGSTDTSIPDATGQTYTLTGDDLNKAIKVSVRFTDDDGYTATLTSAATTPVQRTPNQTATGQPTITGTVDVGETLSADTSGISDGNGMTGAQFTYQWFHSVSGTDTEISGATGSTYAVVDGDAGKGFKVRVSFTDDAGHAESAVSDATDPVLVTLLQQVSELPGQDFPEDTSTTGVITVGGTVTGRITFDKDVDWWKVTLTAGKAYGFSLVGVDVGSTEGIHNPYLHGLHDSSGTFIPGTEDDDHHLNSLDAYFHFKITTTGTYYIATGGVHTGYHASYPEYFAMGGYSLSVSDITDTLVDDFTAGIATTGTVPAGTVAADGSISGSYHVDGKIESRGDEDWFKVTLTAGKKYMIDLRAADTFGGRLWDPLIGGVYDADGSYIANTRKDAGGIRNESRLIYVAAESGDHFIRAESDFSHRGKYRLSVLDVTAGWPDDYAADTTTNGTVAVGGSLNGDLEVAGDRDWIKVNLTAGVRYRVQLDKIDCLCPGLQTELLIFPRRHIYGIHNSSGDFIDGTEGTFSPWQSYEERFVFTPTEDGDYYIDVGEGAIGSMGGYTLSVTDLS